MSARGDLPPVSKLKASADLPDPLVMLDGTKVESKADWVNKRRPELKEMFQHYMYGYAPPRPANLKFTVERIDKNALGGKATLKEITISFGPAGTPKMHLLLVIPNKRSGPAPVFAGLNFTGNHSVLKDADIRLPETWLAPSKFVKNNRATDAGRGTAVDTWSIEQTIDAGYAVATVYYGDIDPDRADVREGVQPHLSKKKPGPHDCGTIAAWAWGVQRIVDYLVTDPDIDATRIIVFGHSRLGKTALLAAALDERIALAIPHQAGCGGTAPSRGTIGESVKQINDRFPHWFNGAFKEFNKHPELLPFDQHCLVALVAPRPVLFSNAAKDTWANPDGQFDVLRAADPVYRLLGAGGLEAKKVPPLGKLVDSNLGYFIRAGVHSTTPEDWHAFTAFADKNLPRKRGVRREGKTTQLERGTALWVYIGTSQGIYRLELDLAAGKLSKPKLAAKANSSFQAIHPSGKFLYAVSEISDAKGKTTGGVSAFAIEPDSGDLKLLNQQSSGGAGPCHLVVDKSGKNVLVSNYSGGSAAVLPIKKDGKLAKASDVAQHRGRSVNPDRQNAPYAHSINLDPGNRFAFVADLGLDKVMIYKFDPARGTIAANDPPAAGVAPGAGPRHFAFHPGGKFAYVINELGNTVTVFKYNAKKGALTEIQSISSLPAGFKKDSYTAEVVAHPSGKFVYGSNRGHDSIAIFKVDAGTGKLTAAGHQGHLIKTPRNFAIEPSGQFLLAASQNSGKVIVFRIDQESGVLEPTGSVAEVPTPVCVRFLRRP